MTTATETPSKPACCAASAKGRRIYSCDQCGRLCMDLEVTVNQAKFIYSQKKIVWGVGGAGEGKTFMALVSMLQHAASQPPQDPNPITGQPSPIQWGFIRDTHANLKRISAPAVKRMFPGIFSFHDDYHIMRAQGLEVQLFGMDRPDDLGRIQGAEFDGVWLEEPAPIIAQGPSGPVVNMGVNREVFTTSVHRMRGRNTRKRYQITMNPADRSHWTFYERELNPEWEGMKEIVRMRPGENPHYSESDRKTLQAAFADRPDLHKRYVLGIESEVYPGVSITPEYNPEWHKAAVELKPLLGCENFLMFDGGLNPTPYSADTEILTEEGWKLIGEAKVGEKVITLNPQTFLIEPQAVQAVVKRSHTGPMYHWHCHDYDVRVTNDHAMPYFTRQGNLRKPKTIAFARADKAPSRMVMPRAGEWIGTRSAITLPAYQTGRRYFRKRARLPFALDAYCAFMGIYLSEGSCEIVRAKKTDGHATHFHIQIWQRTRDPKIEKILVGTPFHWVWDGQRGGGCWRTSSVQLCQHLKPFGKSFQKYVPPIIKTLSPDYIRLFLDAYMLGDGSGGRTITTVSQRMADDLQELYLKIGLSANIVTKDLRGKKILIRGREIIIDKLIYLVRISTKSKCRHLTKKNLMIESVTNEPVCCVTVPNHIIYVRRNGKALWGGNCVLGQLTPTGRFHIIDCVLVSGAGMRQLLTVKVIPLLNSPRWKRIKHSWRALGDESLNNREQSDSEFSGARMIDELLAPWLRTNAYEGGVQDWDLRREAIKTVLERNIGGLPALLINPVTTPGEPFHRVHAALAGGYCYKVTNGVVQRERPDKNIHSHVGDSITHSFARLFGVPAMPMDRNEDERSRRRAEGYSVGVYIPGQGG